MACPSCRQAFPFGPVAAVAAAAADPRSAAPVPTGAPARDAGAPARDAGAPARDADPDAALEERIASRVTEKVLARLLPIVAAGRGDAGMGASVGEAQDDDARRALVCDPDPAYASFVATALQELGYLPQVAPDLRTAWRLLDMPFAVVVVADALADDAEAGAKIMDRLSRLPGAKRRTTFVAYVSNDVRSMDGGLAFVHGANVTIARSDAQRLREILRRGIADRDKLYKSFLAVLKAAHGAH